MKAYVRIDPASQEVECTEVPMPAIGPEEVLVRVAAFGVGIHDRYFIPMQVPFPYTIGSEGAGTITETGTQVTGFSPGDRVVFTTILQPQGGSWAEYAATHQSTLIRLPEALSFAQGAALPIAGKTALECIRSIELTQGDSLFIAGASGAIGTLVIQMAAARGIRVAASASEKNQAYMQALGAEKTVDYHDPNWPQKVLDWSNGGVDVALAIQPGTGITSIQVVKEAGRLITVSGDSDQVVAERAIAVSQMGHQADTQHKMVELVDTLARGEIKIVIEKEYPFEQALEALKKAETRHARGKLVVRGLS